MFHGIQFPYFNSQQLNLDWLLEKIKGMLQFLPNNGTAGQILRRTATGAVWSDEVTGSGLVDSVNGMTGDVVLGKANVGLGEVANKDLSNVDNVRQYSADNPPPYPVKSVNGQTGNVNVQPATDEQVTTAVNIWLGDNVAQETGYVLDGSLSMSNAAAPADKVGDLKSALLSLTETGSVTGTGAGDYFINFPVKAGDKIQAITTVGVNIHTRATKSGANIEELGYVNGTRAFTATADAEWFKLYFTGAGTASFTNLSKQVSVLEVDAAYLSKNVDALETAFNEAITSNINSLEFAEKTTNTIWSRNSGKQSSSLYGVSFSAIPIKSGTTYYFRNIYAYFSLIKKLDGTFTPLTDDTNAAYSGTYTADDDGYACITISNDPNYSTDCLFTDSQKMYNDANPRTYFVPNKLQVGDKVFAVGSTREYTRLRDGIAEAIKYKNSTVFVDAGTYDLCTEFASEITANQAGVQFGIGLGNGVHVVFEAGAKVIANYTGGVQNITSYFNPFYPVGDGCFTLENADIDVKNTGYCVHDEWSGHTEARNVKYINCKMVMDNTNAVISWYPQCIGGGNGASDYISIENCYFKSKLAETAPAPLVSYHNNNSGTGNMKSDVHVSNCYFADKGTFRCAYSGQATAKSSAYVSNCSLGANPIIGQETSGSPENYELITWMNEVRSN